MADTIYERSWPLDGAKAGVVIVHGLAEHSGRYEHVAKALNEAGYAAYSQDIRGHGQSVGFPGDIGGALQPVITDVVEHINAVHSRHAKTFVIAHSMGTLLALPAIAELEPGTIAGLVLSGLATSPGPAVMEALTAGGPVPAENISKDPSVVEAYINDPLVFYDRVPMELTMFAAEAIGRAMEAIPTISDPVFLVHGGDDRICEHSASEAAYAQFVTVDKAITIYSGLYHEVFNEPEQDKVIADVITWLDAH